MYPAQQAQGYAPPPYPPPYGAPEPGFQPVGMYPGSAMAQPGYLPQGPVVQQPYGATGYTPGYQPGVAPGAYAPGPGTQTVFVPTSTAHCHRSSDKGCLEACIACICCFEFMRCLCCCLDCD